MQIRKRNRDYESGIREDYLKRLNDRYENWIENYTDGKKLIINVDKLKFADNDDDFQKVLREICIALPESCKSKTATNL
jgi:deoxyadenosine/deoxycytidine kinase